MRQNAEITISRFTSDSWGTLVGIMNVPITTASRRKFHLMAEDSITLVFSLDTPYDFKVGDFINDEAFGLFILREKQFPSYNKATGGYDYNLRFDRAYWLWENHINMLCAPIGTAYVNRSTSSGTTVMTYNEEDSYKRQESVWCLTAKLADHLEQVLCNLIGAGLTYYGRHYRVRIQPTATKAEEIRFINYDATHICTALNMIAEAYECEWWVTYEGDPAVGYINFGKCEDDGVAVVQEPDSVLDRWYLRQYASYATIFNVNGASFHVHYYRVRPGEKWIVRCEGAAQTNHVDYAFFSSIPASPTSGTRIPSGDYVRNSGTANIIININRDGYLAVSRSGTPVCKKYVPVELRLGNNVETMQASRDLTNYANRIYAFGGTQNVPTSYRKKLLLTIDEGDTLHGRATDHVVWRDSARKINPYTMLAIAGVEAAPKVLYFPTDMVISGASSTFNYTAYATDRFAVDIHTGEPTGEWFGYKRDRKFTYSDVQAGMIVMFPQTSGIYGEYVGTLFIEDADGNRVFESIQRQSVSWDCSMYPTGSDRVRGWVLMWQRGEITLEGGKKYRMGVNVKATFNTAGTPDDGAYDSPTALSGSITCPMGKTFQTQIIWDSNEYTVTFNPLGLPEGEDEVSYFQHSTNYQTFGVGSVVELLGYIPSEIPEAYYTEDLDDPSSLIGLGDRRLRLPSSTNGYVETDDLLEVQRVEMAVKMDDIYPRCYLRVTSVTTEQKTDREEYSDGTTYEWEWTAYTLQAELINGQPFPFSKKYVREGEKLQALFLSDYDEEKAYEEMGLTPPTSDPSAERYLLAGMKFDVGFREDYRGRFYTLIRNEDYGAKLPSSKLMPKVGDVFVLTGWNVSAIESLNLVTIAESQLEEAALEYLEAMQEDGWTFRCSMMTDEDEYLLAEGTKVEVIHDALVEGSKVSRVIGYELKLDFPHDSPVYEIGETDAYSRIKQMEKKIQAL